MALFPSEYIHIGGDEAGKQAWKSCPKCQARIKAEGIKGDSKHTAEEYLQSYVISRMEKFVESKGRHIIGWDEILEGGLAPNATVMSWRGVDGGIEAAKPGNRMCDVDLAARNYIEEKGFGEYFTHRTGHSIGLEDHEFGDVSSVNTDIIKVGQCFSVEPGIYLPDENIGVRIEDLVIITEDGCEVLNDFTKDLIVVPEE